MSVLERILAYKREEVAVRKAARPWGVIEDEAFAQPAPRDFFGALVAAEREGRPALIAEIKKASPSKGLIRADFHPAELARAYEAGGAACLSVLTDTPSFQGHDDYLREAKAACALPILRKDFIVDDWQVFEARALGADAVLLIMAAFEPEQELVIYDAARECGLTVLVEVHDEAEMRRAVMLGAPLIGVNNRSLATFETDLGTTERLAKLMPPDRLLVSESGINSPADIARLKASGASAFLVGESLMRQDDVEAATRALLGR